MKKEMVIALLKEMQFYIKEEEDGSVYYECGYECYGNLWFDEDGNFIEAT